MSACRPSCRAPFATTRSMCAPTASRSRPTSRAKESACRNISSPPACGRAPLLEDDHGVKPSDIPWVRGGIEDAGRPEKITITLPKDVKHGRRAGRAHASRELLEAGEIDGFIARACRVFRRSGSPNIGWLFADPIAAGQGLFQAHRHFPDHACRRHPPRTGGGPSVAAGGGVQGVRASRRPSRWKSS